MVVLVLVVVAQLVFVLPLVLELVELPLLQRRLELEPLELTQRPLVADLSVITQIPYDARVTEDLETWRAYLPGALTSLRRRRAEREARLATLRTGLMAAAHRAATALAGHPGVQRVVLFGSAATGTADEHSDLDLAVVGLTDREYFRASADAVEAAGFEVDLVQLEQAPASLREVIERDGITLYERS